MTDESTGVTQTGPRTWFGRLLWDIGMALGAIRRTLRPRYVKYLEAEVERLRGENRGLWNLLTTEKGHPPLVSGDVPHPTAGARGQARPTMRGKSWPQIRAELERRSNAEHLERLARMRKEAQVDAELRRRARLPNGPEPEEKAG
jgi:hypothetical protein